MNDRNDLVAGGILWYKKKDLLKWECINTIGEKPSPRAGHTAVVHSNGMYVFGGYDKNGLLCHDLFEFTFDLQQWKLINPLGNPPDIFHHAAITHLGSMYTFGGRTTTESISQASRCELQEYRFGTFLSSPLSSAFPSFLSFVLAPFLLSSFPSSFCMFPSFLFE